MRPVGPKQRTTHLASWINGGNRRTIRRELTQISGWDLGILCRRRAQALVIDDQYVPCADNEAIDLAGDRVVADQADERDFGLRVGPEQRGKLRCVENRQDLGGDRRLLAGIEAVDGTGKEAF